MNITFHKSVLMIARRNLGLHIQEMLKNTTKMQDVVSEFECFTVEQGCLIVWYKVHTLTDVCFHGTRFVNANTIETVIRTEV